VAAGRVRGFRGAMRERPAGGILPLNVEATVGTHSTASHSRADDRDAVESVPTRFRGAEHESLRGSLPPRAGVRVKAVGN